MPTVVSEQPRSYCSTSTPHFRDVQLFRETLYSTFNFNASGSPPSGIFLRFYLIEREVHPSKDRYWKRIIRDHLSRLTPSIIASPALTASS